MRTTFLLITLLVVSCITPKEKLPGRLTGKVVAIIDGDTFKLLTHGNTQLKIRLHGIDSPEKSQDFGQAAKQKLSQLIFGKQVIIEEKDIDRYGRTIAIVYNNDGDCINETMLKSGLAWHYKHYDDNRSWAEMEENAKDARLGLWSKTDALAPWMWRKQN